MAAGHTLRISLDLDLGHRVRLARIAAGRGIDEMAEALELSRRSYERIESGTRPPRFREVVAIAQLTGQDVSFFGASLSPDDGHGDLTGGGSEVNAAAGES